MGDLFAPSHILLVLIFALLFFGPSKLPELGRSFGKTIKAFKEGTRDIMNDNDAAAGRPQAQQQRQQAAGMPQQAGKLPDGSANNGEHNVI